MKTILANWKTSLLGILLILGSLINAGIEYLKTGSLSLGTLQATGAAFTGGMGLLHSADANPTPPPPVGKLVAIALIGFTIGGLAACAVDPVTGARRYVGPSVGVSAGYNGVSAGFTLYGDAVPYGASVKSGSTSVAIGAALK